MNVVQAPPTLDAPLFPADMDKVMGDASAADNHTDMFWTEMAWIKMCLDQNQLITHVSLLLLAAFYVRAYVGR